MLKPHGLTGRERGGGATGEGARCRHSNWALTGFRKFGPSIQGKNELEPANFPAYHLESAGGLL